MDSILPLALCHHSQREDHKKSADEHTDSAFHFHLPISGYGCGVFSLDFNDHSFKSDEICSIKGR